MPLLLKITITPSDEDSAIEHQTVILPVIGYRDGHRALWALDPTAISLDGYAPIRALYEQVSDGYGFLFIEYTDDKGTYSAEVSGDEIVVEVVEEYPKP